ncbi:uncharacterized protein LOC125302202 isoform X2 [Alosa alosa]|uniref:uncharacterized protein LOC125302202 isoform X2 n=1 Tax=Alosa alosa TaxID=278164 RepID=UPI0020152FCF|nr:uncharacterized protein LOC125302202 isoform X2 [Alosa alosa]
MPKLCAAIGCNNRQSEKSIFSFPNTDRKKRWLINIRRADLSFSISTSDLTAGGYGVCEDHFNPSMIIQMSKRKRLTDEAVPTIINCPNPPKGITIMRSILDRTVAEGTTIGDQGHRESNLGTDARADVTELQKQLQKEREDKQLLALQLCDSRKDNKWLRNKIKALTVSKSRLQRRLRSQINDLKTKLQAEQGKIKLSDTLATLPPHSREFLMFQAKEQRPIRKCRKFPKKIKDMALQIIHQSPATYKVLRTYFCLPCPSTLRRYLANILGHFKQGFLDTIIAQMKNRVKTMEPHQRNVAIVLDEMAIKKHLCYNPTFDCVDGLTGTGKMADHAMVIMCRGIASKWKQAIAYFFAKSALPAEETADILVEAVRRMARIGLTHHTIPPPI